MKFLTGLFFEWGPKIPKAFRKEPFLWTWSVPCFISFCLTRPCGVSYFVWTHSCCWCCFLYLFATSWQTLAVSLLRFLFFFIFWALVAFVLVVPFFPSLTPCVCNVLCRGRLPIRRARSSWSRLLASTPWTFTSASTSSKFFSIFIGKAVALLARSVVRFVMHLVWSDQWGQNVMHHSEHSKSCGEATTPNYLRSPVSFVFGRIAHRGGCGVERR